MLLLALTCTMGFSACGEKKETPDQVVVDTPAEENKEEKEVKEEPTPEPTATPTPAANLQVTTYKTKDQAIAVTLPDAVWANKMDADEIYSFSSAKSGSVLIEHGAGEEAMNSRMIPNTVDLANAVEQAGGLTAGTDFEVRNFAETEEETHHTLNYAVVMLDASQRDYAFKLVRTYYNDNEYYVLTGIVNEEDSQQLAEVTYVMDHLQILREDSTIILPEIKEAEAAEEATEAAPEEKKEADAAATVTPAASNGGIAPYRDNPDNSDNSKTRTIYRNSNGKPLVISINANGEWVDIDGNKYRFTNECDVYDQNDVDYYYHGEAADVYYMPVE